MKSHASLTRRGLPGPSRAHGPFRRSPGARRAVLALVGVALGLAACATAPAPLRTLLLAGLVVDWPAGQVATLRAVATPAADEVVVSEPGSVVAGDGRFELRLPPPDPARLQLVTDIYPAMPECSERAISDAAAGILFVAGYRVAAEPATGSLLHSTTPPTATVASTTVTHAYAEREVRIQRRCVFDGDVFVEDLALVEGWNTVLLEAPAADANVPFRIVSGEAPPAARWYYVPAGQRVVAQRLLQRLGGLDAWPAARTGPVARAVRPEAATARPGREP